MHRKQGWKEITPEGAKREVRATREGPSWRIQSRLKGEPWTYHDPVLLKDLETLHELLKRKQQRRRCSLKEVEDVARLIAKHPDTKFGATAAGS